MCRKLRHLAVLVRYTCLCCACIVLLLVTWLRAVLAFCLGLFRKKQEGRGAGRREERERDRKSKTEYLLC